MARGAGIFQGCVRGTSGGGVHWTGPIGGLQFSLIGEELILQAQASQLL